MSMNPHSKEITGFVFYIMSEIYWYGRNWELIVVYEKQVVNNYIYVYEADVCLGCHIFSSLFPIEGGPLRWHRNTRNGEEPTKGG